MTAREALRDAAKCLAAAGVANPRLDARLLLGFAENIGQAALLADPQRVVDGPRYEALVARRVAREPMAYILGRQEFWSLPFQVSPATLIPRADSEAVVEAALAGFEAGRALDLGTGTGCLLLAILQERPGAWGVGIDAEPAAAKLAAANARALGMATRAMFLAGDWDRALQGRFELVVSNPPYIGESELPGLAPEVKRWEPRRALLAGPDGLLAYRALVPRLAGLLAPDGLAVLEVGAGQAATVGDLAAECGLAVVGIHTDLGGIERALTFRIGGGVGSVGGVRYV